MRTRSAVIRIFTLVLSVGMTVLLQGCGLFDDGQQTVESVDKISAAPPTTAVPTQPVAYDGPSSLESRILKSPVIARVRLDSATSTVEYAPTYQGMKYSVLLEFSFSVLEYLKGQPSTGSEDSGTSDIVVVWAAAPLFDTRREAEDALPGIATARDTQWDDREAIVFLQLSEATLPSTQQAGRYYLAWGGSWSIPDDGYSIASVHDKLWLPAEAAVGAPSQPSGGQQRFLTDVPPAMKTDGRILGTFPDGTLLLDEPAATGPAPTITLGEIKTRVAAVTAKLDAGDGSEEYRECVERTYLYEGMESYRVEQGHEGLFEGAPDPDFGSGLAAASLVYEQLALGGLPNRRDELWFDGEDAIFFRVEFGESIPHDFSGDGMNDSIKYAQRVVSERPLPVGTYEFTFNQRNVYFVPCEGYTVSHEWTVTVTAPEGTIHEAFFDPATTTAGVGYFTGATTTGVLKPAEFSVGAASTTITDLKWQSGAVVLSLSPFVSLGDNQLEFIALDGTTAFALRASDATADSAAGTLTWAVTDMPWSAGDLLMLRIGPALDSAPAPQGVSLALADDTFTISWNAVSGADRYRVQYRTGGADREWTSLDATATTTQAFGPAACETSYEFRVQARGDGETYFAGWSEPSGVVSHTTGTCNLPPVFSTSTYSFSVAENAAVWSTAATVLAMDPDGDFVTYHITAGNTGGKFETSSGRSGGHILVWGALDYESVSSYTLTLEARDGKENGTDTATVVITVTNVPEGRPPAPQGLAATSTHDSVTLSWNAVAGADRYRAQHRTGGAGEWTSLDATATTTQTFSPAACETTYEFRVQARGDGKTYLVAWGQPSGAVSHTTGPCNRPPVFATSTYAFSVAENAATSTVVGRVSATDPDGDFVSYSIASGNDSGVFSIYSDTGELFLAGAPDYDAVWSYTLTVQADDGNGGVATATVVVSVTDFAN